MDTYIKWYIFLLTPTLILKCVEPNNDTTWEQNRQSRVNGRIVKLYSGAKHESIICNDEGFRADPVECSTFYRCIKASRGKYSALRFQCGPGTIYDPDSESCNHPYNTKRPECRSNRPFQFIPVPVDPINDNDIVPPVHELPFPITTSKRFSNQQTLNHEAASTSKYYPFMEPVASQSSELGAYGPIDRVKTTINPLEGITSTTVSPTSESSVKSTTLHWMSSTDQFRSSTIITNHNNECIHDGFMGDADDCRKFYRCVNNPRGGFIKYEFMCSESTIWDDDMQNCNHPWAVRRRRCARGNTLHENTSKHDDTKLQNNKNITEAVTFGYGNPMTQTPMQVNSEHSPTKQISYGDRINIDKVWNDKNNINIEMINKQDRLENTYSFVEKPTSYIPLPLNQTRTQAYESITTSSYPLQDDSHDYIYGTNQPINKLVENKCIEPGFIGDLNDCRKFYRCVENGKGGFTRHEFQCGEGTAWDIKFESCNHIWLVRECKGKISSNSYEKYGTDNLYTSNSFNITTDENYGYKQPKKQITFGPVNALGVTQKTLKPNETNVSGDICNSVGFRGSDFDCKKFYRCIENKNGSYSKLEYMCDEGTAWDPNIESCNYADKVKHCGVNSENERIASTPSTAPTIITTISIVQTTEQANIVDRENDVGYDSNNYKETTPKVITIPNDKLKTENSCKENGFMADNYDCRKFYRCVDNGNGAFTRYEYLCGEGTGWDVNIIACNHIGAVVNCGNRVSNVITESTPSPSPPLETIENENSYTSEIPKHITSTTISTTLLNSIDKTTASNKENVCSDDGFIGDKFDCKKFYRCVSKGHGLYEQHEFLCGEGTVWDPDIEACNHAWAVKKCGGKREQNGLSNPHSSTTSIPFNEIGYTTHSYNTTEIFEPIGSSSSTENIQVIDDTQKCQSVGFLADKNNCKTFYECVENGQGGFIRYEFSCGEGTAWDQNILACNYETSVDECKLINNNMTSSNENTSQSPTHIVYPQESSHIPSYIDDESTTTAKNLYVSNNCKAEGFYGDENDCKKFYRCVPNQKEGFFKYEFICGEGTIWDQKINACNHASSGNVNCFKSTTILANEPPESTLKPNVTEILPANDLGLNTTEQNAITPIVETTCYSEGFYPNLEDCKKFFRCVSNGNGGYIRYDFACGEGTIWVQKIQACDHDSDNTTCNTEIASVSESHKLTTKPAISDTSAPHSETTSNIIITTESTIKNNTIENNDCHSEGYFPHYNDCRRFYRCVSNEGGFYTKYDYYCGEGTAWDTEKQSCNHMMTVKRCQNSNAHEIQTTLGVQTERETSTTEVIGTSKTSTTMPESAFVTNSDCKTEGFFGNKKDCQKFYRCVDNGKGDFVKYDFICGDGTIWDQNILTCNHPRDVKYPSCYDETLNSSSTTITESSIQSTNAPSTSYVPPSPITTQSTTTLVSETTVPSTSYVPPSQIPTQSTTTLVSETTVPSTSYVPPSPISTQSTTTLVSETTAPSTSYVPPSQTPTQSTTTLVSETTSQGSSNGSQEEITKNPKNENITCTKAGFYPNPNDCKKFYRCVDWDGEGKRFSVFHFECGEGTIWDPALNTCNYEESVYPPRSCNGIQNTTTETTTIAYQTNSTSSTTIDITSQTSQPTEQSTTESTTIKQSTTEETTTMQPNTEGQITITQSTTSEQMNSSTLAPTDATYSTTSEVSTTDHTTTTSEKSTTTTEETSSDKTTITTTEQPTTTTDKSTTTSELTTTEQSITQTALISTESTTKEDTTTQTSTTQQQTSTELTTENLNTSSTTESSTSTNTAITTESTQETTTQGSSSVKDCPDTESDQYLYVCPSSFKRHPKYCNLFYQCVEDNDSHELKIAVFNCPNGTIYDETKIQCVGENKAEKKCQGSMATKRRFKRLNSKDKDTITVSENKYGCLAVGHYPFEKNEECSPALLKCEISKTGKLHGFVYRCPENYVYWSVSRRCEPMAVMTKCKLSLNQWSGRTEIPIERKNIAQIK